MSVPVARNLLKYRVNTLEGAKRKAKEFGHEGAFFAWESQETGDDACTLFNVTDIFTNRPLRTYFKDKQIHISADIVFAMWDYCRTTGDYIQAKYEGFFEMLLLELTTGMRRGELLALQWDDLNFETGELHICRQVYHVKGSLQITEPKTKNSIRTIILSNVMLGVLAEYKKTVNSRWMFPSPVIEDMPRNPQSVYKTVKKILKRSECKNIRFHDLRHTFSTTSLANGMPKRERNVKSSSKR